MVPPVSVVLTVKSIPTEPNLFRTKLEHHMQTITDVLLICAIGDNAAVAAADTAGHYKFSSRAVKQKTRRKSSVPATAPVGDRYSGDG